MLNPKIAVGQRNGHVHAHHGTRAGHAKSGTMLSFFSSLKKEIIEQFRSKPFSLDQKSAEKCAGFFMKGVRENYREAKEAGFLE